MGGVELTVVECADDTKKLTFLDPEIGGMELGTGVRI